MKPEIDQIISCDETAGWDADLTSALKDRRHDGESGTFVIPAKARIQGHYPVFLRSYGDKTQYIEVAMNLLDMIKKPPGDSDFG